MVQSISAGQLSSMTGFARYESAHKDYSWVWELRSVNGRGLELRSRMPHGFDDLDMGLKAIASKTLTRGSVNVSLVINRDSGGASLALNTKALSDVMEMVDQLSLNYPNLAQATPEGILSIRGVVETVEEDVNDAARTDLIDVLKASFHDAVKALHEARCDEGRALGDAMIGQLDQIKVLTNNARSQADELTPALMDRIRTQIRELADDSSITADRLAQEVAILAVKADIREELDRLDAHIAAAYDLLNGRGAVGRKFDFLMQEFNREANTLCSKAADITLKQTGLDLKAVIDQMREQVQNVE